MDGQRLDRQLEAAFGGTAAERRVVVRQAMDLHDSGRFSALRDRELSVEDVIDNLRAAPDALGLVERWNWWVGALALAHDDFDRFRVRRHADD